MFDYEFKRLTRRCCKTDREFRPGDEYYSALVEAGDQFLRQDFSATAWDGPPPGAIGWWRCRLPQANSHRAYWAPVQVLLDYFGRLADCREKAELYYLMALVLLRKKIVQLVDSRTQSDGSSELVVLATRTKQEYTVPVFEPPPDRLLQLQDELC
jgi:hypothetical protein